MSFRLPQEGGSGRTRRECRRQQRQAASLRVIILGFIHFHRQFDQRAFAFGNDAAMAAVAPPSLARLGRKMPPQQQESGCQEQPARHPYDWIPVVHIVQTIGRIAVLLTGAGVECKDGLDLEGAFAIRAMARIFGPESIQA